MKEYIEEYLMQLEVEGRAESTITNTKVRLNKITNYIPTLDDLNKKNVNNYILSIKDGRKITTVNEYIKTLRNFIQYLYEEEYISKIIPIKTLKPVKELSTVISDDDVEYIIKKLKKDKKVKELTIFTTFIYTGIRVSELVEIKLDDIKNDTIKIYSKKTKQYRLIPISPQLKLQLQKYMRVRKDSEYLFSNRSGKQYSTLCIYRLIKNISKYTSIYMHPHILRHYYCINMLKKNVPINIISRLLGHVSIETTMIYARELSNEEVLEVYSKY